MIFYYNASGDILSAVFDEVYQGSNKANTIYFVCPSARSNSVSVAFTLPDGTNTSRHLMALDGNGGVEGVYDGEGNIFNVWKYKVPSAITCKRGTVRVQFYIVAPTETVSTAAVDFTVRKGVAGVVPEIGDSYEEVISLLSEISQRITDAEDDIEDNATDIGALDVSYGATLDFSVNNSTYVLTATLKNKNGTALSTQTVDLPLESVVVGGSYNDNQKSLILNLQNGNSITIPVTDLISGLVSDGRTIAGNALSNDISANTLFNSLFDITEITV